MTHLSSFDYTYLHVARPLVIYEQKAYRLHILDVIKKLKVDFSSQE